MDESWRELRIGDRVRIVRMPSGVDTRGYFFHDDLASRRAPWAKLEGE